MFERPVSNDFVGIYVRRCSGAAVVDVDDELIVEGPADDFLAGSFDGSKATLVDIAKRSVRPDSGELDHAERLDERLLGALNCSRDPGIRYRALRLGAVIGSAGTPTSPSVSCFDAHLYWEHHIQDFKQR